MASVWRSVLVVLCAVGAGLAASSWAAAPTPSAVTALAFSPSGDRIAVGRYGRVEVASLDGGGPAAVLPSPGQVACIRWRQQSLLAAGGIPGESGTIRAWGLNTNGVPAATARILTAFRDVAMAMAAHPTKERLAAGSMDRSVSVWMDGAGVHFKLLSDHVEAVMATQFSPDGRWLLTAGSDRTAKLYDADTLKRVNSFSHPMPVLGADFSNKSELVVTTSVDRQVRWWHLAAQPGGAAPRSRTLPAQPTSLAVNPMGSAVAVGCADGKVRLLNGDGSSQLRELTTSGGWIQAVDISADGLRIACGSSDGRVSVGPLDGSRPLAALPLAVVSR